jgi:hypothetical protein
MMPPTGPGLSTWRTWLLVLDCYYNYIPHGICVLHLERGVKGTGTDKREEQQPELLAKADVHTVL